MALAESYIKTESQELGNFLLDIGISLFRSGSNSNNIKKTITGIATAYKYSPQVTIGANTVSIALTDEYESIVFNSMRSTASEGVNFSLISDISRLSGMVAEKQVPIQELKDQLTKSQSYPHFPRIIILCFVSLAGAALCYTFGGNYVEMLITFGATFCGLFVKQQVTKKHFNPYICTYGAATVASLFIALFHVTELVVSPVRAFSTCVLFLIPGVLMINSFKDLIDGNTITGIVRGINALLHALAIALGLLTTITIFNLA